MTGKSNGSLWGKARTITGMATLCILSATTLAGGTAMYIESVFDSAMKAVATLKEDVVENKVDLKALTTQFTEYRINQAESKPAKEK